MNRPAPLEISYEDMCFLITHNPTTATLNKFTEELRKCGVTTLVRVCDATYDKAPVEKEGIHVLDWPFDDGAPPPNQIVDDWLNLLKTKFPEEPGCCVAVPCVAGLGRAPVLAALALTECGMKYEDAAQVIRQKGRGAFDSKHCFTWRDTDLRFDYASEIPAGTAVCSRSRGRKASWVVALEGTLGTWKCESGFLAVSTK